MDTFQTLSKSKLKCPKVSKWLTVSKCLTVPQMEDFSTVFKMKMKEKYLPVSKGRKMSNSVENKGEVSNRVGDEGEMSNSVADEGEMSNRVKDAERKYPTVSNMATLSTVF
ncbi:hypothetical protein ACOMHN_036904 [Nucella lapillus]